MAQMTYRRPQQSPDPGAYLRTKVMTASPEELRLMLFDGAVRFAERGKQGILDKDHDATFEGVTRCQAILMELINSLQPEHDPALCNRLAGLYTFMYSRLMTALHDRNAAIIDEVLQLLRYERETWLMLMDKVASERGGIAESRNSDRPQMQSLSVQG